MKLNVKALSVAAALIWGGCLFFTGLANMIWPAYGESFLQVAASIYPGFEPGAGFGSVIVGMLYGLLDGAVGGALLAWIYDIVARG